MSTQRKILLIEDDSDIRSTLKEVLELEGYPVETAVNGQEGLDLLEKMMAAGSAPTLILLDLMMPVMNGWQFLEQLEARGIEIPVTVITAHNDRVKPKGATALLRKPLELDTLIGLVQKFCAI